MSSTPVGFIREDPWRIFRIMAEFVDSFETLSQAGPAVTIFGSARTLPHQPAYQQAVEFGRRMAQRRWMVVTGAAAGLPEGSSTAASR